MIISRYLRAEVFSVCIATTGILLLVLVSNQFVHYLTYATDGRLTAEAVLELMSLQVPILLGLLLPLALYISILLAYGRLHADSEMVVLSSCGLSPQQLLRITLSYCVPVMLVVAVMMLWVEPKMAWARDHIIAVSDAQSPIQKLLAGRFQTFNHGRLVVYTRTISSDHKVMRDVFVATRAKESPGISNAPRWDFIVAKRAREEFNPQFRAHYLVFHEGYRYHALPGVSEIQEVKFKEYGVRLVKRPLHMSTEAEFIPTPLLWRQRHSPDAAAELQWRLSIPLSVLFLAMVAVPISQVSPRKGRFARLVPAILIYIVYVDLLFVARAWVQKGEMPMGVGLWGVHVLVFCLAIGLWCWRAGWRPGRRLRSHSHATT